MSVDARASEVVSTRLGETIAADDSNRAESDSEVQVRRAVPLVCCHTPALRTLPDRVDSGRCANLKPPSVAWPNATSRDLYELEALRAQMASSLLLAALRTYVHLLNPVVGIGLASCHAQWLPSGAISELSCPAPSVARPWCLSPVSRSCQCPVAL